MPERAARALKQRPTRQPAARSPATTPRRRRGMTASVVRVRYAETDQMGVVYYANYLVWFEVAAPTGCARPAGRYRAMEDDGLRCR